MMRAFKLRDKRLGQWLMNGALAIGFLAAVSIDRWPEFMWLSETVIVLVTVIAGVVYYYAKCVNRETQEDANAKAGNNPVTPEHDIVIRRIHARVHGERLQQFVATKPIMQGDIERWLRGAVKPESSTLEEYKKVLMHNIPLQRVIVRHSEMQRISQYERRLRKLEEDIKSIMRVTEPNKNTSGRLVVDIGPVKIEIGDEETKVQVAAATPVITNVSAGVESSAKVEVGEPVVQETFDRLSPSSKAIH
jgi:hypothetical protein